MLPRSCLRLLTAFSGFLLLAGPALARHTERAIPAFSGMVSPSNHVAMETASPREPGAAPSALTITQDPIAPLGDTVPKGATRLPMLRFRMTADCTQEVTVEGITFTDRALGFLSDIAGLWMSVDGVRVSRAHGISADRTSNLTFRRPLIIAPCATATIDVFAAIARDALTSGRHTLSLESAEDIRADVPVEGEFPLRGGAFTISTRQTGVLRVAYLPIAKDAEIDGTDRQVIGRFSVAVDGTEDQTFRALTLENAGSADDGDVVGIYVRAASGRARFTTVAAETRGDRVTLVFDPPYPVLAGKSLDFEVIADVVDGTGSMLRMRFGETTDVYATGSLFSYGVSGQLYGSSVTLEGEAAVVRIAADRISTSRVRRR